MPKGFRGSCYVFDAVSQLATVNVTVRAMQEDNQPHNLLFTPPSKGRPPLIYICPKPHIRPKRTRDVYPYEVGSPELIGIFTLFTQSDFDSLSPEHADELVRINTARLPDKRFQKVENPSYESQPETKIAVPSLHTDMTTIVTNWTSRPTEHNDAFMRESFDRLLIESEGLSPEMKGIAYNACDELEVTAPLSNGRRKRLDPRRKAKMKPWPLKVGSSSCMSKTSLLDLYLLFICIIFSILRLLI